MADYISEYSGQQIDERLGLAGTAYQKPADGIPAEDIAPGVIPTDVVKFSEQELTDSQKEQARENIGAYAKPADGIPATDLEQGIIPQDVLQYSAQELSEAQQEQARANIGAYHKPTTGIPAADLEAGVIPGIMTGAGESTPGAAGIVPAPMAGDNVKFLRGDGTWQTIGDGGSDVFVATYGTTTYADIAAAVSAGKLVVCNYDTRAYVLARSVAASHTFVNLNGIYERTLTLTSANVWSNAIEATFQTSGNMKSAITQANHADAYAYPNFAALNGNLYQWGVISQTQEWSGTGSTPRTYEMKDLVYGLIPQMFIDLVTSAGATFNSTSGYFELNGLTDISYREMQDIYNYARMLDMGLFSLSSVTYGGNLYVFRVNFGMGDYKLYMFSQGSILSYQFYTNKKIEILVLQQGTQPITTSSFASMCSGCEHLKEVKGILSASTISTAGNIANIFANCFTLEKVNIKDLKVDVGFAQSPNLSPASVAYMINNVGTTNPITITLHPTAYAAAIADADVTAALMAHSNVTLASV